MLSVGNDACSLIKVLRYNRLILLSVCRKTAEKLPERESSILNTSDAKTFGNRLSKPLKKES